MSPQVKGIEMLFMPLYRKPGETRWCVFTSPHASLEEAQSVITMELMADDEEYEYAILTGQITHTASIPAVVFTPVKAPAKKPATKKPVKKAAKN